MYEVQAQPSDCALEKTSLRLESYSNNRLWCSVTHSFLESSLDAQNSSKDKNFCFLRSVLKSRNPTACEQKIYSFLKKSA